MIKTYAVKRAGACLTAAVLAAVFSSCSLLPEEETFAEAPTVQEYEGASYVTSTVKKTDVSLTENLSVNYVAVQSENLSFSLAGKSYGEFLVSAGDQVEAGELLATLDMADLETQSDSCEEQLTSLQLKLQQTTENKALALREDEVRYASLSASERAEKENATAQTYDAQIQSINDSIYILQLKIADLNEKIAEREIRAPFSGTITYVLAPEVTDLSEKGKTVIKIADSSMSLFRGSTVNWDCVDSETEYTVTVTGSSYAAHVKTEAELGIPETTHEEGTKGYVYFVLDEPAYDISDSATARVSLVLDSREDVLAVPNDAVSTINGETVVYYPADTGIRKYKSVTIGLVGDKMTEIVSGMEEGEVVIIK